MVDNPHRSTVLLKPDPQVGEQQKAAEKERLSQARAQMSQDALQKVIENTRELKRRQETPDSLEALATIPRLTLQDLDKKNKIIPVELFDEGQTKILYHDLFTNGIVYLDLGFDLHTLAQELIPYVPLFGQALTKMGTQTEDFVRLSQRIGQKTGGISAAAFASAVKGSKQSAAWLFLRAKSTIAQADDLSGILRDILLTVRLDDPERFKQIVLETKARKEASLVPGGHMVVRTRLNAHWGQAGWVDEQMNGVNSLFFLRRLVQEIDRDWPSVLDKLEQVRSRLINRRDMVCNVTLAGDDWTGFHPKLANLIDALPAVPIKLATWKPELPSGLEGLTIPARVNYVAKGANLYDLGYELHGSVAVIAHYLRTTWLWERVRVRGGAYGGSCAFDPYSGAFSYFSYRDPNLLGTLENYDQTAQFLQELELSDDELVKGIIGAIGRIDDYLLPDAKGYTSLVHHLINESDEERQLYRDQVLSTTAADFRAFAQVLYRLNEQGLVKVMGSSEAIQEANKAKEGWLQVTPVL